MRQFNFQTTDKKLADKEKEICASIDNLQNQKIEESANKPTENFSKENLKIGNSAGRFDSISDVIPK